MTQYSTQMPMSFNPLEHELPTAFNFITKSGKYPVVIQKAYLKPTTDGASNYLALELKIQGGEFDGIVLTDRVNIFNQSMKAREFALKQLTAYCTAVGINQAFNDAAILVNRQLQVYVSATEEPSRDNADVKYWKNDITDRFYADGSDLVRGNWGGQQQPQQQQGFAAPAAAVPQGYAQPAPAAAGYAQPTAAPVPQPSYPSPTPAAPVAAPAAPQQAYVDPNAAGAYGGQVAAPAAPQAPVAAPAAPAAPVVPQQPQVAAPVAPTAPQGGFAPPAAGAAPSFAPPQ